MPNSCPATLFSKALFQKSLLLSVAALFVCCSQYAQQQPPGKFQQIIDSIVRTNQLHNRSLQHGTFSFNQPATRNKPARASINIPSLNRPLGLGNCVDTSSRVSIGRDSAHFYVGVSAKTKDGNLLISGEYYNYWDQVSSSKGFLMKCDLYGNVIWAKLYDSTNHQTYHYIVNYYVTELMDGSILMGGMAPDITSGNDDMVLTRTDANGNIIWVKDYYSLAWSLGNGSADYFDIIHITQDPSNGDVYISSSAWGEGVYVIKVNISDGSIPWSNMIRLYTNGYGFQVSGGVAIRSNDLVAFATTSPYNTVVMMYRINKATGDTLSTKILESTDTPYYKKGFANLQSIQQLSNGNIALAGTLYGYYQYMYNGIDPLYQAGVIEVDQNLDFVKGYALRNNVESNYVNSRTTLNPDGSGLFNMLKVNSGYSGEQYFIQFKDGVILKERTRSISNEGYPSEHPALQLSNGGEMLINLVGDSLTNNSRVVFTKLHLSDTSSDCLGHQIYNTIVEPIHYGNPVPGYMDSTRHFVMQERHIRTITAVPYGVAAPKPTCYQVANCDTLILKASADTICPQVPFFITARKNKTCGSKVQFSYDTSAVQSFTPVNDSVYQVVFKGAWKGIIMGSLAGCVLYTDSVPVTVLVAPPLLSLGPDTVLCPGNQIILNALSGYASYRWQNGATDSFFTVTQPGKYTVEVFNACGDRFTDTVIVAPHPPIPFYIGPDTSICENQIVTFNAPAGFISYQWTGAAINNDTLSTIDALPPASGWYKVTAAQTPGCLASDSLYVTVKQTPAVHLGNDTSLCTGQTLWLKAGMGYDNYTWSTGHTTDQVPVNQPGVYIVAATLNGCTVYDTLKVLNVYPLPVFTLGNDTVLCLGRTLLLSLNLPQATYQWSDQTIGNSLTVTKAGTYSVQVSIQGCSSSDTVAVSYINAPVFNLGKDTSLCQGKTLTLNATSNGATYLWQDGSTAATYPVSSGGTYRVTASIGNCSMADTISVSFIPVPVFTLGRDTFICISQQLVLAPSINTAAQLLWQDGSSSPTFTVTREGLYRLQASNQCGTSTDEVNILQGLCTIEMPSAFSPNGDGNNDLFRVKFPFAVKQFNLIVYNRYGEKIFETSNISQGWDGTWKGKPQPSNSYVWTISYKWINDVVRQITGTLILLR